MASETFFARFTLRRESGNEWKTSHSVFAKDAEAAIKMLPAIGRADAKKNGCTLTKTEMWMGWEKKGMPIYSA